jgi:hypothetical protein
MVEGVLLAHARGYLPEDVVINTDCDVLGNANLWLHPGNYMGLRAEQVRGRLRTVTNALYSEATYQLALYFLQHARINKLKGHSFLVDQERADYLARQRAWQALDGSSEPALPYSEWLTRGFEYYTRDSETPLLRYAAFSATEPNTVSA